MTQSFWSLPVFCCIFLLLPCTFLLMSDLFSCPSIVSLWLKIFLSQVELSIRYRMKCVSSTVSRTSIESCHPVFDQIISLVYFDNFLIWTSFSSMKETLFNAWCSARPKLQPASLFVKMFLGFLLPVWSLVNKAHTLLYWGQVIDLGQLRTFHFSDIPYLYALDPCPKKMGD